MNIISRLAFINFMVFRGRILVIPNFFVFFSLQHKIAKITIECKQKFDVAKAALLSMLCTLSVHFATLASYLDRIRVSKSLLHGKNCNSLGIQKEKTSILARRIYRDNPIEIAL